MPQEVFHLDPLFIVKSYLEQNPPATKHLDLISPLEILFDQYTQIHSIDNDHIRECFSKIRRLFDQLDPSDFDQVFDAVCELCLEYEHTAFFEGFRIGAHLILELNHSDNHETVQ